MDNETIEITNRKNDKLKKNPNQAVKQSLARKIKLLDRPGQINYNLIKEFQQKNLFPMGVSNILEAAPSLCTNISS